MLDLSVNLNDQVQYILGVLLVSFHLMHLIQVIFIRLQRQHLDNAAFPLIHNGAQAHDLWLSIHAVLHHLLHLPYHSVLDLITQLISHHCLELLQLKVMVVNLLVQILYQSL